MIKLIATGYARNSYNHLTLGNNDATDYGVLPLLNVYIDAGVSFTPIFFSKADVLSILKDNLQGQTQDIDALVDGIFDNLSLNSLSLNEDGSLLSR